MELVSSLQVQFSELALHGSNTVRVAIYFLQVIKHVFGAGVRVQNFISHSGGDVLACFTLMATGYVCHRS